MLRDDRENRAVAADVSADSLHAWLDVDPTMVERPKSCVWRCGEEEAFSYALYTPYQGYTSPRRAKHAVYGMHDAQSQQSRLSG